ncbi:hypothetical protein EBR96_04670 [bacterium]|nr:hypothetical protein [bacterium]
MRVLGIRFNLFLAAFFAACFLTLPGVVQADPDPHKLFVVDNVVQTGWGKLVSVYDQPNFQRMTFESPTQITIVQIGLVWDNKENAYRPSVKQVIAIPKIEMDVPSKMEP